MNAAVYKNSKPVIILESPLLVMPYSVKSTGTLEAALAIAGVDNRLEVRADMVPRRNRRRFETGILLYSITTDCSFSLEGES